jgi:hypothetical protein
MSFTSSRQSSRSSAVSGSWAASGRQPCPSVRRASAKLQASSASSLAPAGALRSRRARGGLGVHGVDGQAQVQQPLDGRAAAGLDRDGDAIAAEGEDLLAEQGPALGVVGEPQGEGDAALSVDDDELVLGLRPVQAREVGEAVERGLATAAGRCAAADARIVVQGGCSFRRRMSRHEARAPRQRPVASRPDTGPSRRPG